MAKKKPVVGCLDLPEEAAESVVNEAAYGQPDPVKIQQGLAALHMSFKEYKALNDQRHNELRKMVEDFRKRIRGGA